MKICEALIVSVDFTRGEDVGVLIVGRKNSETKAVDIVNAFQGDEAYWLYQRLITQNKQKEQENE